MQLELVTTFVLDMLRSELSPSFTYHNVDHTKDVMRAVKEIGSLEQVDDDELQLLLTAALFHDAGFLISAKDHEMHSCDIAGRHLPHYGYTNGQLEEICQLIMATKMPQQPKNHLEEIICDADLDYLGRNDFFDISKTLYEEMKILGSIASFKEYLILQLDFLSEHRYFTSAAKDLRNEVKEKNLIKTKSLLYPSL